jgi:hypothetical protein
MRVQNLLRSSRGSRIKWPEAWVLPSAWSIAEAEIAGRDCGEANRGDYGKQKRHSVIPKAVCKFRGSLVDTGLPSSELTKGKVKEKPAHLRKGGVPFFV